MQNTLYFGDNLHVLREYIDDESVDLIYLDPPFNSNASYNVLFKTPVGGPSSAQIHAFEDTWRWGREAEIAMDEIRRCSNETFKLLTAMKDFLGHSDVMAYLAMMALRLIELRRVLKTNGTLYLHCDPTASHYLKVLLDGIFRVENFRNEISWRRSNPKGLTKINFPNCRDVILRYSKNGHATFNKIFSQHDPAYVEKAYKYLDENGRRYRLLPLLNPNDDRPNLTYEFLGVTRVWRWTQQRMQKAYEDGTVVQLKPGAVPQYKKYLDDSGGRTITNDWNDILLVSGNESLGYPTQKPLSLLERIISVSSNPGDVVLDPFCGCGTAVHAAEKLQRNWIGIDVTYLAIQLIEDRMKTWLPLAKYVVDGIPKDPLAGRRLAKNSPYQFQLWAVGRVGGQSRGQGADRGIDGEIIFLRGNNDFGRGIVSVKAGRHVNPDMIRALRGTMERENADLGIFICMEAPTKEMKREAASCGLVDLPGGSRPRIQIVTIDDLIVGPNLGIVTGLNSIQNVEAARVVDRKRPKQHQPEKLRREPMMKLPISGGKASQKPLPLEEPLSTLSKPKRRSSK
ncbi:MAG TPA: DNA methyltransferase [Parvibaculum sp.]|jgi:site-specific DNA-methyltransferase (adenine-specific)